MLNSYTSIVWDGPQEILILNNTYENYANLTHYYIVNTYQLILNLKPKTYLCFVFLFILIIIALLLRCLNYQANTMRVVPYLMVLVTRLSHPMNDILHCAFTL